jgi:CBS domain-containing protein
MPQRRRDLVLPRAATATGLSTKVRDFMNVPPATISDQVTIDQAGATMWEDNIGSLIVVDGENLMAGIITERDILFAVTKSLVGKDVPATSIMSKTSLMATPNESIVTAVDRMIAGGVRHLPVIDKDGKPLGMLSLRDVMGISEPLLKFVFKMTRKKKKKPAGSAAAKKPKAKKKE